MKMVEVSDERELNFPYLKDEDQSVAKSYGALVTLHAFVLDDGTQIKVQRKNR